MFKSMKIEFKELNQKLEKKITLNYMIQMDQYN
jgi:hypothetical protein